MNSTWKTIIILISMLTSVILVAIFGSMFIVNFPTEIMAGIISTFMVGIFGFIGKIIGDKEVNDYKEENKQIKKNDN